MAARLDADERLMRVCLREAARARGRQRPNPMVGALVVSGGRVLARGHHARAGEAHAEICALAALGRKPPRGSTLYVTLEPCSHHGRTPPCAEAVLRAGFSRVVIAMRDPFPLVDGRGMKALRAGGVAVEVGVCEAEARALNAPWLSVVERGRPLVTLKLAVTLDGRIAARGGDARWVTGEASRRVVHRMRDASDAILVGVGTVLADDPGLDVRGVRASRDPVRVVLDSRLRTPVDARLLAPGPGVIIFASANASRARERALRARGAEVVRCRGTRPEPAEVLAELARRGILSLLVEGGGQVAAAFLGARLVDRAAFFVAPKLVGADGVPAVGSLGIGRMAEALSLAEPRVRRLGDDVLIEGRLGSPT